tara:strand:+ start:229 stop:546 length:318 start_codon:yes stop_codon:yes gene_type:complete
MEDKTNYRVFGLGGRLVYLVLALALLALLYMNHPIKFELFIGKATYASLGAILGYFIDVILFPNFRLNDLAKQKARPEFSRVVASAQTRRALIVTGCVLGVCLGI